MVGGGRSETVGDFRFGLEWLEERESLAFARRPFAFVEVNGYRGRKRNSILSVRSERGNGGTGERGNGPSTPARPWLRSFSLLGFSYR